ncbi:hypothetical protein ACFLZ6_01565 [Nanoarchaeota archaeon]
MMRRPTEDITRVIEVPSMLEPVYAHVEDCIRDSAVPGLYLLGMQGGHIYLPDDYVTTDYSDVSYGYINERPNLPSIDEMEAELELYIADAVTLCTNFNLFYDLNISVQAITADVEIKDNEVIFNLKYPIIARAEGTTSQIEDYRVVVPLRIGFIYKTLNGILSKTLEDPDWIDLTYLSELDVQVELLPHNENTLVYSITDNKPMHPYMFFSAFTFKLNLAPVFYINDTIMLVDGEPVIMQVEVIDPEGDDFVCSDDTALFDITEDCNLLFTPDVPGVYDVMFTAIDARNNKVRKKVKFVVRE